MHASVPISCSAAWQTPQFSTPGAASSAPRSPAFSAFGELRSDVKLDNPIDALCGSLTGRALQRSLVARLVALARP
jgi:hypothetical protein